MTNTETGSDAFVREETPRQKIARLADIVREHERFMWGNATTVEKLESGRKFDAALDDLVSLARRAA